MLVKVAGTVSVICMFFATPAIADAPGSTGRVKICRQPKLTELMDKKTVLIPAKSSFEHPDHEGPDAHVQFIIETTADAKLPPKPGCVVVSAVVTENLTHGTITAHTGLFQMQFSIEGLTVQAKPIEDFH